MEGWKDGVNRWDGDGGDGGWDEKRSEEPKKIKK